MGAPLRHLWWSRALSSDRPGSWGGQSLSAPRTVASDPDSYLFHQLSLPFGTSGDLKSEI